MQLQSGGLLVGGSLFISGVTSIPSPYACEPLKKGALLSAEETRMCQEAVFKKRISTGLMISGGAIVVAAIFGPAVIEQWKKRARR